MQKIKMVLAYDGSDFAGSQIQPRKKTVQGELHKALKFLCIESKLELSGRTDRFVHAFRQVVSLELPLFWNDLIKLQKTLNSLLPQSIIVRNIQFIDHSFHARFSAKKREYRYIITEQRPSPFEARFVSYYPKVDKEKILQIAQHFCGTHDFAYFSKKGSDPKSTIRIIESIQVYQYKKYFVIKFRANSYLRSQIRMMVAFIMDVAYGKLSIEQLLQQLSCQKMVSNHLAPPNGLYLSNIIYESKDLLFCNTK